MTHTPEQLREWAENILVADPKELSINHIVEVYRAHADALDELERVRKENTSLRALQVGVKCAYGYRMENGACQLGYPGCACMDDLCATMEWGPGDLHARANKRLQERAERAEAALAESERNIERLTVMLRDVARDGYLGCGPEGFTPAQLAVYEFVCAEFKEES